MNLLHYYEIFRKLIGQAVEKITWFLGENGEKYQELYSANENGLKSNVLGIIMKIGMVIVLLQNECL